MEKLQLGRITLNDAEIRNLQDSGGTVKYEGIITGVGEDGDRVRTVSADIPGLLGTMVPAVFGSKVIRNGYYAVTSAESTLIDWPGEGVAAAEWSLELALIGYWNDVDLESRLGGPLTLNNAFTATGERWHAPPIGHVSYWTGAGSPSQINRVGSEGTIKVYRDVPINTNVRWNCGPHNYGNARVRFTDHLGIERVGLSNNLSPVGWELTNTLVRVRPAGGTIVLETYWNGAWRAQNWDLSHGGTALGVPTAVSLIRNDFEMVQVRMLWSLAPSGRVTADLTLRRGARYVEVFMRAMQSTSLALVPTDPIPSTAGTGFVSATANDASGNRYIAGSPNSHTTDVTNGGLSRAATVTLDAFIGVVAGGGSAAAGDTAADVYEQFLGAPTERVIGVRL